MMQVAAAKKACDDATTTEELEAVDRVCIICREQMDAGKKLPCGKSVVLVAFDVRF